MRKELEELLSQLVAAAKESIRARDPAGAHRFVQAAREVIMALNDLEDK